MVTAHIVNTVLVTISCTACWRVAEFDNTTRSNGTIVESGELTLDSLTVGDCLAMDLPVGMATSEFEALTGVPCSFPHDAQVYATVDFGHLDHPSEGTAHRHVSVRCADEWRPAIGTVYLTDLDHDVVVLFPTRASLESGASRGACLVVMLDGSRRTGSLIGANRHD